MKPAHAWRRLTMFAPMAALAMIATPMAAPSATGAQARASSALTGQPSPCPSPGRSKPTVVLVHGAWADASSWDGEVEALQRAGYVARAIANPLRNLTGDAATVADFLKTVSGPIVLVGHSYGGSVITNAAAGVPNVKALVYVDAAVPDIGETTGQLSGSDSALNKDPASSTTWLPTRERLRERRTSTSSRTSSPARSPRTCPGTPPPGCGPRSEPPRPARS
ncbi:alpha/beta fold hydrolase [Streptosporangium lutulentum]